MGAPVGTGAKPGLLQDSKKKPRLRLPPRILKAQKLTFYTVSGNPGASPHASASRPVPLRTSQPFRPRVAPGKGRVWTAEGQGALAAPRPPPTPITARPHPLPQPNDNAPVKLNTAAILREGALYQRQVEKALQRWAREGLGHPLRGPGGRDTVPREQPQGLKKASARVMAAAEEGHLHSGRGWTGEEEEAQGNPATPPLPEGPLPPGNPLRCPLP